MRKILPVVILTIAIFITIPGCNSGPSELLCPVNLGGEWGYINQQGRFVIDTQFDTAQNFSEGLAAVSCGEKYGFVFYMPSRDDSNE